MEGRERAVGGVVLSPWPSTGRRGGNFTFFTLPHRKGKGGKGRATVGKKIFAPFARDREEGKRGGVSRRKKGNDRGAPAQKGESSISSRWMGGGGNLAKKPRAAERKRSPCYKDITLPPEEKGSF